MARYLAPFETGMKSLHTESMPQDPDKKKGQEHAYLCLEELNIICSSKTQQSGGDAASFSDQTLAVRTFSVCEEVTVTPSSFLFALP